MNGKRQVGILFGGRSVEHEVSVTSARGVVEALTGSALSCVPLAVTDRGRWLSPELSRAILESDEPRVEPGSRDDGAQIAIVPASGRLMCLRPGSPPAPVDLSAIFPLIHGWGGEDGRLQGMLEIADVPYVGSGVLGSAAAMDKAVAKQILATHGVPGVRWLGFERDGYRLERKAAVERVATKLDYPVFVKPANGGSSVGITRVVRTDDLDAAMERAFTCDRTAVVEQAVNAREIECAVIGNDQPQAASALGEIVPSGEFYDYEAKYHDDTSELLIPAELDPEITSVIRRHAITAFRCLGLTGLARVDFLVDRESGEIYLNEVNTLPGFTRISMFSKLWEASGLPYAKLIERLVDLALTRWNADSDRRVLWREA